MEHDLYIELLKIQQGIEEAKEQNTFIYDALIKAGIIKEEKKKDGNVKPGS